MRKMKKEKREGNGKKILAEAAGILLALTFAFAPTVPALANTTTTYGTGQIEIDNVGTQKTSYKAFQIFKANKNDDGTLSNFAWPSNSLRNAVIGVIQKFKPSYSSFNAQDAADYISHAYLNASGQLTTDQTTILNNTELLNQIAAAADDTGGSVSLVAGKATLLDEGYWMIVTDGNSVGMDEDGTSPIYAISSGGVVKITEKTTVPVVDKQILNDADGAVYTYGAEAERGQAVQHKVTGNVAVNIRTYSRYYYEFEDVMSRGIDYVKGSYSVKLDGTDVTDAFSETLTSGENGTHKLSISCNDILAIPGVTPKGTSQLVLTYNVKLNDDCVVGAAGNPNEVKIHYSSNPNTNEKSETHTVKDYLYTFALHVEKKDRDTNVSLAGAKFTIQATAPDDTASKGLYVQADGRLGASPYEFVTKADGTFNVTGLDAGTYTLHETQAPSMYKFINADTKFTIGATYNSNGSIATLTNTVSENADAVAGIDSTNDNKVNADPGSASDVNACLVNVTVGNIEKVKMPLSGQEGLKVIYTIGGIMIIGSAGLVIYNRRKKKQQEDEAC